MADVGEFFKMMCFGSMHNNDAFGVFNHNTMFKKTGAFDASKLDEYDLTRENFIVGHNRFSTEWTKVRDLNEDENYSIGGFLPISKSKSTIRRSAKWDWSISWGANLSNIFLETHRIGIVSLDDELPDTKEDVINDEDYDYNRNHHPFKLGDFTLMHNGMISNAQKLHNEYNFQTTISTDSYVILELIDYFFKKSNIKDRVKRISMAIQDTCDKLKGGYSVVLYDKRGKNKFYFKNAIKPFSLCKYGDSVLCGSTSHKNLDYLYFGMEKEEILIKNKRVYLITSDKTAPVIDVTSNKRKSSESKTLYDILSNESDYEEKIQKLDVFLEKALGYIPLYYFTLKGHLKIARNNTHGIKEKIYNIVEKPRKRFGWYIIKPSDVEPKSKIRVTKVKKVVKAKKGKVKLNTMKGGKK